MASFIGIHTVPICFIHIHKSHMVEPWWKMNYWLWVKGRPGSVFCVSVSMQHSIMGLNHPLLMLRWAAQCCPEPIEWPYSEREPLSRGKVTTFPFWQRPTRSHFRFKSALRGRNSAGHTKSSLHKWHHKTSEGKNKWAPYSSRWGVPSRQ